MFDSLAKLPFSLLVISLLYSFAALGVAVAIIVATAMRWSEVKPHIGPGFRLAAFAFALAIPAMVAQVLYFEVSGLIGGKTALDPDVINGVARALMVFTSLVVAVLGAAYSMIQVGVGELAASGGHRAYPLLVAKDRSLSGWWIAAAFGVAVGIASVIVFRLLNVREGAVVELVEKMMPKLREASPAAKLAFVLPAVLGAAVTEEVLFRGVIQAWLAKWLGPGRAGVAGAIVLTAAFWAVAHVANTDAVWLKCLQIFLIGLGFGAIARRFSVEASIVGHMGLNLAAGMLGIFLLPGA